MRLLGSFTTWAVGAIWKDGIGVINGGYLVVANTTWTVSVHPSAAVADIRRS